MKKNMPREIPDVDLLEEELHREKYKKRYRKVLRSTIYTLITVAAAAVLIAEVFGFLKFNCGLVLKNAELTDTIVYLNHRIPQGVSGKKPLVAVAAVTFVNHAAVVCLYNAEVFECRASGKNMRFIALRQLHCHAQRYQPEFARF